MAIPRFPEIWAKEMAASKRIKSADLWKPVETDQNEGKLIKKRNVRKSKRTFSKDEMIPMIPGASINKGRKRKVNSLNPWL